MRPSVEIGRPERQRDRGQQRKGARIAAHDQRQSRDRHDSGRRQGGERACSGQRSGLESGGLGRQVECGRSGQGATSLKVREEGIERCSRRKLTPTVYSPGGASLSSRLRGTSVV